jgi:hypothetical protein
VLIIPNISKDFSVSSLGLASPKDMNEIFCEHLCDASGRCIVTLNSSLPTLLDIIGVYVLLLRSGVPSFEQKKILRLRVIYET